MKPGPVVISCLEAILQSSLTSLIITIDNTLKLLINIHCLFAIHIPKPFELKRHFDVNQLAVDKTHALTE